MRRPALLLAPVAVALIAGAALIVLRSAPADPRPPKMPQPPAAVDAPAATPAAPPVPKDAATPAAPKPPTRLWAKEPDRARRRWAKALVQHPPTLTRDQLMVELARIERLPDGDERIDAVRALFGSDQIDRTAADHLLALYDRSAPGDFRKVLFGALLFSTADDYVAEQMLFRARAQDPDTREVTYLANLSSRHAEAWELLCDSVPACRSEDGACRAALAVAGMAADYPPVPGGADQVRRLQSLLTQTTSPAARIYLFEALLATPGAEGMDGARAALLQERDEEVRQGVLRMRPALGKK